MSIVKYLQTILSLFIVAMLLSGCGGGGGGDNGSTPAAVLYTIDEIASPQDGGNVTGAGTYADGDSVTLTAAPNAGFSFVNWTEDGNSVSSSASYTFTATAARTLTANFLLNSYTVSATAGANGTITPASQTVNYGSTTSFTVTPAPGYIASVSGCGGTLVGSTYTTGAITGDCTVTASFAQLFTVTATAGVNGSISPSSRTVASGSTTTFTVTPVVGYGASVSGCGGTLTGNTYTTGPITANCTVSATFVPAYSIGGSVSGLVGSGFVLQNNGSDDLSISADGPFTFASLASTYNVTVKTQPTGQLCTVIGGSGTATANVVNISVACVNYYTVSGTATGVLGTGLVLQLNGANDITVNASEGFTFNGLLDGSSYTATIKTQPSYPDQICTLQNGSGTINGANITNLVAKCQWTKQMGGTLGITHGNSVATDSQGYVYVTGVTNVGIDGQSMTGVGAYFLSKFSSAGAKSYTKVVSAADLYSNQSAKSRNVATDANDNVYVVGTTSPRFNSSALYYGFFLTKFNSSGTEVYSKYDDGYVIGTGRLTDAFGVATDSNGNVFVAGDTNVGLDGNTLTGTTDFFVTKYDASGNKVFTKQLGASGVATHANGIATDANGNFYVVGKTSGGLDGNTLIGTTDLFVTMYDATGTKIYTKQFGKAGTSSTGVSIAADLWGNVYFVGTENSVNSLTKLNALGSVVYTKQLQAAAYSVTIDTSGNVFISGATSTALDGNVKMGNIDFYYQKFDAAGTKIFTRELGGASNSNTYAYAITTDPSGNALLAGYTTGGLDGNTLTGREDVFVAKYDPSGVKQ